MIDDFVKTRLNEHPWLKGDYDRAAMRTLEEHFSIRYYDECIEPFGFPTPVKEVYHGALEGEGYTYLATTYGQPDPQELVALAAGYMRENGPTELLVSAFAFDDKKRQALVELDRRVEQGLADSKTEFWERRKLLAECVIPGGYEIWARGRVS